MLVFMAACSDDNNVESTIKDGPKPTMDIAVSPEVDLKYGDVINVSGIMNDERNLEHYELLLTSASGDTLASKYQMLLGKEFVCDDHIQVPLPKNAAQQDLQLTVKLDNTRNGEEVQTFDIYNVSAPEFGNLNLILGNGQVVELVRNGDMWETASETMFPAKVKGIISTTTSKSGIWWGTKNGDIASMAKDSIVIGGDVEASFTVAFNPYTFELTQGEHHFWVPVDAADCYYILGTISGHWMDGEIKEENKKMKLTGYESGTERYYTWTAPEGDDPATGMWGSTAAGTFRLKKGGADSYILWNGQKIVVSGKDNRDMQFPLTAAGPFTIRANFAGGECESVEVAGGGKAVSFGKDGSVVVNGVKMGASIAFCNSTLQRKAGTSYIYEGKVKLTKGQVITSQFDLSGFKGNSDLFKGIGNSSWTLTSASDTYYVRMDPFAGELYACPTGAYPDFIYLDGWSLGPNADNDIVWSAENVIPLVRNGSKYEGTFYDFGWGGDIKLYLSWPGDGKTITMPSSNFTGCEYLNAAGGNGSFTIPSGTGFYKIVVDLKEGVVVGEDGTVTNKGSQPFTLEYVAQ